MFNFIGIIRSEKGAAVFLDRCDKTHFLGCKFKTIMGVIKYYDENFRVRKLWLDRDNFFIACHEPKSVCNVLLELPKVSKEIQKRVYSEKFNIEINGKIFDGQVERFLYERFKYIFSRKKND